MIQETIKEYQQKIKEIQTYARTGTFSIPQEKIDEIIKKSKQSLRQSSKDYIKTVLSDPKEYGKKPVELENVKNLFSVLYERYTFWQKITFSKRFPRVKLNASTEEILRGLGKKGDEFLKYQIILLDGQIASFRNQIKSQLHEKKSQERKEEIKNRFADIPYKDSEDMEKAAINPAHVCLVHATKYFPKKNKKGQYEIETLSTATHLRYPRNTIHFSLNHHVQSHLAGSWNDMPYVILTPLDKTSNLNGRNPAGVSTFDTFFEMDLDENLKLPPEAFLIYPAPAGEKWQKDQVYKIGKNHAIYRADDDTAEQNKLSLVNAVLIQKGYRTDWMSIDASYDTERGINSSIMRMGEKMGSLASKYNYLHSATTFGTNGIGLMSGGMFSPEIIGPLTDFIHMAASPLSKVEKGSNTFKVITPKEELEVPSYVLTDLFSQKGELLKKAHVFWDQKIATFHKEERAEYLLGERTKHVFEAWKEKQDKVWAEDLPKLLKKYPTFEEFQATAEKEAESSKSVSKELSLAQKKLQNNQNR